MPVHSIEARSFAIAIAWCHNFWVLKNADGSTIAELHGLAYDRIHNTILPIGTTKDHALRTFVFPHDPDYARRIGRPMHSTRMYCRSRAHVVYQGEDGMARWNAAVAAIPLLDELDIGYPPYRLQPAHAHDQQQRGLPHVRRDHGRAGLRLPARAGTGAERPHDQRERARAREIPRRFHFRGRDAGRVEERVKRRDGDVID